MSFDREATLKKADKLLRQGKVDAAIEEYERLVEDQPRDWALANTLGDLYGRAGQTDRAAEQYTRIAENFLAAGFYPKAAAVFKKILKIDPDHEPAQLRLGEISQAQGLLADAKSYFHAVGARRRARGDRDGAAAMVIRTGEVDPADFEARTAAARTLVDAGRTGEAAVRYRELHDALLEKDRPAEALEALREAVRLNPQDRESRALLVNAAVAAGDLEGARAFLDRETAGRDPVLLAALLETELAAGTPDSVRELAASVGNPGADRRAALLDRAWAAAATHPDNAFALAAGLADAAARDGDHPAAAAALEEAAARIERHQVAALQRLIDVAIEGGLEETMTAAQERLADVYLSAGEAPEARSLAERLVARAPWISAHLERFRRALAMLKVSDPDTVIAQRLGGETPFIATDPFAPEPPPSPPFAGPPPDLAERPALRAEAPAATPHPDVASDTSPAPPVGSRAIRLSALSRADSEAEPAPSPPDAPPQTAVPVASFDGAAHDEIDLNAELAGPAEAPDRSAERAPGAGEAELGQAFSDFRQEVVRQTGADHSAQHMSIGRTYLEMGMRDQAVEPLTAAARSAQFRFEAASLLGRIFREHGDLDQAIQWFDRAADAPAPSAAEARTLLYELGCAVEDRGDTSRALAIFLELRAEAGEYLDVASRIERLSRVEAGG